MNEGDDDISVDKNEDSAALPSPEALETSSFLDKPSKKKLKKGVFNKAWLNLVEYKSFLNEYKPDSSQATCIICNQQFSVHYRGKALILAIILRPTITNII
ncbi:unnamed protein product [Rotaria sp. Silwood2]|nr:unnamed protein product [Rotaria sp. Silwood2]CAF3020739.1 unnamed protein product [Rotaria sp. Silwood2]CAF3081397.1 unnamed protein product [Rotaria sp. Silwood2]CAF3345141.1 unnamed protein product [Rotaria sp. Silwood2]CAF4142213.1 unnamed protein product [Rotaria sp. Silwood2]